LLAEVHDLYLEAEQELKEIVGGFTHTFVHNLLRDVVASQHPDDKARLLESQDMEDGHVLEAIEDGDYPMDRTFSSFPRSGDQDPFFPLEDLPCLGGSPQLLQRSGYAFYHHGATQMYSDVVYEEGLWPMEDGDFASEEEPDDDSFWEEDQTPPSRAENPLSKNSQFGVCLASTTDRVVISPSSSEEEESEDDGEQRREMHDWRQRRKRIMSEPPRPNNNSFIECF